MQANTQVLSEIKSILHGRAPLADQSRQLSDLAMQVRDQDDLTGYKTVLATFSVLSDMGNIESLRFSPGPAFEAMYAGIPQSLVIEHKPSKIKMTLAAGTPDLFAQSSLNGLDQVASSSASQAEPGKPASPQQQALSKDVSSLLMTARADISEVMDIMRRVPSGASRGVAIVAKWKNGNAYKQAMNSPQTIPSLLARLGEETQGGDAYSAAFLLFVLSETKQAAVLVPLWSKARELARTSSVMDAILKVVKAPSGQPSIQMMSEADRAREAGDVATVRKLGREAFTTLKGKEASGWRVSLLPDAPRKAPSLSPA